MEFNSGFKGLIRNFLAYLRDPKTVLKAVRLSSSMHCTLSYFFKHVKTLKSPCIYFITLLKLLLFLLEDNSRNKCQDKIQHMTKHPECFLRPSFSISVNQNRGGQDPVISDQSDIITKYTFLCQPSFLLTYLYYNYITNGKTTM